jgi:flagellar hook-associated protein 1 FlgK
MSSGLLNISTTGLYAAQAGLLTTSHNISNVSTPGYNRQVIEQTSNFPLYSGIGYIGQGTNVSNIKRVYDNFLGTQVLGAQTTASQLGTYAAQISRVDNLLGDASAGLSPTLQSYFSAVSAAAANPSSLAARQSALSSAQALTGQFQTLNDQLSQMRNGVNSQIRTEVTTINSISAQVAALNRQIGDAHNGDTQQLPNDLLDQRDQLVSDLNKEVRINTHLESNGSMSIFFGTGQPLVVGTQNYQLAVLADPEDSTNLQIGLNVPGSGISMIPESLVNGGVLGGLLNYRSQTLDSAQNGLGRIALAFATSMNSQHQLGQDMNGNLGGNLFQPIALTTLGASTNKGNAALTAGVTVSDYKVTYNGGLYSINRQSDNTNLGSFGSLPQLVDGVQIGLRAGTPANGDSFLVAPSAPDGQRVTAMATNTGSAQLESSGSNLQTMTDSDYRLVMTAANTFSLTRLSDNQQWNGVGASQAGALADALSQAGPQGFSLNLSGTMQVGDSFLVRPTRDAARDITVAISDPRLLALGTPLRTGIASSNAGSATISEGSVKSTATQLSAPFNVGYEASTNSLTGFPTGSTVKVGIQIFTVTSSTMRVPYTAGANISLNGVGVAISGAPADGDSFTINPPPAASTAAATNSGSGAIAAGVVSSSASLPASAISLTFRPATISPVQPDRLQGFPVGSSVTITPPGGLPTSYVVSAATDTVPYISGADISFNGMSFSISGSPVDGDSFTLGPNPSGIADSRNATLLGGLQTSNTMLGGSANFQTAYAQVVADVGNKAREVNVRLAAQQNLVQQGEDAIQSNSGVNLDEEAANLMRYQQAYQASAKVMSIADKLFGQLLTLGQ